MIHGTFSVRRVIETSACILCEDSRLEKYKKYKVYSSTLTPNVKSGNASTSSEGINSTVVTSGAKLGNTVKTQNYIEAVYVGSDPPTKEKDQYKADPNYKTKKGTKFTLTCLNGDPNNRSFDEVR